MPSTRDIRRRIKSVKNTAQITKAMQMVAASKMRKAQAAAAAPLMEQGAPPQGGAAQPYTVEYYYKLQWGHQQEFLQLFLKNHYPLLKRGYVKWLSSLYSLS